ncbi:MAG: hypothetical protein C0599_08240 [Salinivirgaceae bacterium]|jgi:hypothetical protein|nr:MAG: hypothetical protein C0599_08240 [Salinivirgaceae bacterium]
MKVSSIPAYRRRHKKSVLLNDKEIDAFEQYCKKYKIKNQSKIIRDALFKSILQHYDEDYPTLFSKQELANLECHE